MEVNFNWLHKLNKKQRNTQKNCVKFFNDMLLFFDFDFDL